MFDPDLYARSFADVYDDWYADLDDPARLVAAIRHRTHAGATVLELGSGTGRLAGPLQHGGFGVIALDVSLTMLGSGSNVLAPVAADMSHLPIRSASIDVVLIAYNTLFNLASRAAQRRCLSQAAHALRAGGLLAIEAFVAPGLDTTEFDISTKRHPTDPARRVAILTGPGAPGTEMLEGSHVELGSGTTCRPWQLVYQSPADLDAAALHAGLTLRERNADWDGTTFTSQADRHVSWYERT